MSYKTLVFYVYMLVLGCFCGLVWLVQSDVMRYALMIAGALVTVPLFTVSYLVASSLDRVPDDVLEVTNRIDRVVGAVSPRDTQCHKMHQGTFEITRY